MNTLPEAIMKTVLCIPSWIVIGYAWHCVRLVAPDRDTEKMAITGAVIIHVLFAATLLINLYVLITLLYPSTADVVSEWL